MLQLRGLHCLYGVDTKTFIEVLKVVFTVDLNDVIPR